MIRAIPVLLALVVGTPAMAAPVDSARPEATAQQERTYLARRLVMYEIFEGQRKAADWGTMRGDRRWVPPAEFAELVGAELEGVQAANAMKAGKALTITLLAVGAASLGVGIGLQLAPVAEAPIPQEPDVGRDVAPEAWESWETQMAAATTEQERRDGVEERLDKWGGIWVAVGVIGLSTGAVAAWKLGSGRIAYRSYFGQDETRDLAAAYNQRLAAELGVSETERASMDRMKPRRRYRER